MHAAKRIRKALSFEREGVRVAGGLSAVVAGAVGEKGARTAVSSKSVIRSGRSPRRRKEQG